MEAKSHVQGPGCIVPPMQEKNFLLLENEMYVCELHLAHETLPPDTSMSQKGGC